MIASTFVMSFHFLSIFVKACNKTKHKGVKLARTTWLITLWVSAPVCNSVANGVGGKIYLLFNYFNMLIL
jgi:hypothetical protein